MQIHIDRQGQRFGPYPLEQVNQYLASGNLLPTDQAWYEGAPGWMPITQVPGVTAPAFAAAHSQMESMAIGALGVGVLALLLGGVTYWAGGVLMIITIVVGVVGLALGIIGIVRIKNGLGDRRGKGLAISGAVLSPLAVVLAVLLNPGGAEKKGNNGDGNGKSASDKKPIRVSKASRLKCANNLGQICKSFWGFASENDDRLPWQLHSRSNPGPQYAGAEIFNEANFPEIASALGNPKTLLSPCDPGFKEANQQMGDDFSNPTSKGISYGIHHGGDLHVHNTILVFTRNVKGAPVRRYYYPSRDDRWMPTGRNFASIASEKDALWQGGDHERFGMGGLKKGMGQIGMSDGSVDQADDNRFSEAVHNHMNARDGLSPENNGNIWRSTN